MPAASWSAWGWVFWFVWDLAGFGVLIDTGLEVGMGGWRTHEHGGWRTPTLDKLGVDLIEMARSAAAQQSRAW